MTSTSTGPQVASHAPTVGASNLNRWLAPVTEAAWAEIAEEAQRTFRRNSAARRVVDVTGPLGLETAAVNTGHLRPVEAPGAGIIAQVREVAPLTELRVPFTVSRTAVDIVQVAPSGKSRDHHFNPFWARFSVSDLPGAGGVPVEVALELDDPFAASDDRVDALVDRMASEPRARTLRGFTPPGG